MKKYTLITGASSGIGLEMAKILAKKSRNLILVARREDRLKKLKEELESQEKIECHYIVLDLLSDKASFKLFEEASRIGQIDILINNAGIGHQEIFHKTDLEVHHKVIHLNSIVPTELSYYFIAHMKDHGHKSYILNVASLAAIFPITHLAVYCASKSYLKHMTNSLAVELKSSNISFTTVSPGGVATEFSDLANQKLSETAKKFSRSAQDVANLSLEAMFKEKTHYIVGFDNYIFSIIQKILPESVFNSLMNTVFKKLTH